MTLCVFARSARGRPCDIGAGRRATYAIDRGIYVGSVRYTGGADCCPDNDYIQKRCRYLFVTGISKIDARDGQVMAPRARSDASAQLAALAKPENGYCRLFGE
jgi:hypothetical protein